MYAMLSIAIWLILFMQHGVHFVSLSEGQKQNHR
jgi:hypothetical protein